MEYPFKDLMPLDEVLEREGYYKDWTHLDPEVFYSLTQISNFIKTKGYGVDVRLLIAQLAEHFGLKTAQIVDLGNLLQAEHTSLKQQVQQAVAQVNADRNALETRFNQSVAQMEADKNTIVANATVDSEVILARGGKATLGQRLDETTAQLAHIVTVNVKSFGAKGDGVTDDSEAIKNAIVAMPKTGGRLLFPPGVYIHGDGVTTGYSYAPDPNYPNRPLADADHPVDIGRDIRFIFDGYNNLTISGYGATIQSHDGNGECRNNSIFTFKNCNKLRVEGIKIDARSQFRRPVFGDYNNGLGYADRSSIWIMYGEDITFQDVESNYSMMDGFFLYGDGTARPSNVRFINCNAYYNYRQGLTISSARNVLVDGGNYSFTGVLRGTLPMAGIDIEADAHRSENVLIKNATIEDNKVSGVVFAARSSNCKVEKCVFIGRGLNTVRDDSCVNNEGVGNTFINCNVSFAQYGVKYTDNLFLFDSEGFHSGYHFNFENTNKVEGKLDIFERNVISVDLSGVTPTTTGALGCFRLTGQREIVFKNNTIKNSYVNQTGLAYAIALGGGVRAEDNQIIFDYVGSNIVSSQQRTSITPIISKNNLVKGFSRESIDIIYANPYGASSDYRFEKSFSFSNKVNSLYKINNANYNGNIKFVTTNYEYEEYEVNYNTNTGVLFLKMISKSGNTSMCNVYVTGITIFVEPLVSSLIMITDFIAQSAHARRNPLDINVELDTVTDKSTLSPAYKPLLSISVPSKEAITQTPPYKGFTTFDESRNKNITWTGTSWVDQMGNAI